MVGHRSIMYVSYWSNVFEKKWKRASPRFVFNNEHSSIGGLCDLSFGTENYT